MSKRNLTADKGQDDDNTNAGQEDQLSMEAQAEIRLKRLIKEQGITPITAADLKEMSSLWPEDESIEDFLKFVQESRTEGRERHLP